MYIKNNNSLSIDCYGKVISDFLILCVTVPKIFIPGREFIFRTCEVGAVWYLIPRKISSS